MRPAAVLSFLLALAAFSGLVVKGWDWQTTQDQRLAAHDQTQHEVLYWRCVRECQDVCARNGVPADVCDCSHCRDALR